MKKQAYITGLLFIFLTLALTSCKKDEPASLGDLLIGKWEVQNLRMVYFLENVKEFEYIDYYYNEEFGYEFTGGDNIIQYIDGDAYAMAYFTLDGNSISIDTGGDPIEWKNVAVNGNTLTWEETRTEVYNEITYDVEYFFTAVRTSK
jgi:hypothetical protein